MPREISAEDILYSFACDCGAEVHLPPEPMESHEIVCVSCGEFIGHMGDLMRKPAGNPAEPKIALKRRATAKHRKKQKRKTRRSGPSRD